MRIEQGIMMASISSLKSFVATQRVELVRAYKWENKHAYASRATYLSRSFLLPIKRVPRAENNTGNPLHFAKTMIRNGAVRQLQRGRNFQSTSKHETNRMGHSLFFSTPPPLPNYRMSTEWTVDLAADFAVF